MSNEEYERMKKKREEKDKKSSIIVFTAMLLSLTFGIVYIIVNR